MSYSDMVQKACDSVGRGKFASRPQIKSFLTAHYGYVDTGVARNALKKALQGFECKGQSFRVSKEMRDQKALAQKQAALRAKQRNSSRRRRLLRRERRYKPRRL